MFENMALYGNPFIQQGFFFRIDQMQVSVSCIENKWKCRIVFGIIYFQMSNS